MPDGDQRIEIERCDQCADVVEERLDAIGTGRAVRPAETA